MQDLADAIAFAFLFLALGTLALIFRDAFGQLNADDQITFRHWIGRKLSLRNRAVNNIWSAHAEAFPESRKRFLFVFFLIAWVIVGVCYELWRIAG